MSIHSTMTVKTLKCDRCFCLFVEEKAMPFRAFDPDTGAISPSVVTLAAHGTRMDLCPTCVDEMVKWWNEGPNHA